MKIRVASVLFTAIAVLAGAASSARAQIPGADQSPVPVLAQSVDITDPAGAPPGMTVVFVPPAPDGFADGGDRPDGLEWVLPDGFADGGDAPVPPEGFVAALARPAPADFWENGAVPDGLVAVFAWPAPDGFADGGDIPDGFIPVLFSTANGNPQGLGG